MNNGGNSYHCKDWLRLRDDYWSNWHSSAIKWARTKYNSCYQGDPGHEYCRRTWKRLDADRPTVTFDGNKGPSLPYRLIDLHHDTPKVVYSGKIRYKENLDWIPKYTALSYCWGGKDADQLKLTRANRSRLHDQIPMDDLSRAQKDAITVAKDLGFRYLWNDALCICQDDEDDWKTQASQMGIIYQYAACTIVSLMSTFNSSFLNSGPPGLIIPYESSIDSSHHGNFKLSLESVENKLGGPALMNKLGETLPNSRWATRGWTFQEQNNSLRTFFFWPGGLQYNCPCSNDPFDNNKWLGYDKDVEKVEGNYWFSRNLNISKDPLLDEKTFSKSPTVVKDIFGSSGWNKKYLYYHWRRFATDYSRRVFTKETDMYPALWGMAREYDRRLGQSDEYLMGIWSRDIWGFLWRLGATGEDPPHLSLSTLRADFSQPDSGTIRALCSWSWVGNQSIKFLDQTGDMCDDLEDFRSECEIDTSEFYARDGDHSKGYAKSILKFRAKRTKAVVGYQNPEPGTFGNEVTVSVEYPEARVFCALDWRNVMNNLDDSGRWKYDGLYVVGRFLLLASAAITGRTDGCRAALGIIVMEANNARDHDEKIWYRCGVFVAKPPDGWVGQQRGGVKIFDEFDEETTWVK
jgi:hypothetical protein